MKAIIHVGMPKTGSTSIKTWLRINRAPLAAHGVHSNKGVDMYGDIHRRALQHATFLVAMQNFVLGENGPQLGPSKISNWQQICENYNFLTELLEKSSVDPGVFIYSDEDLFECNEIQVIALDKYLSGFFDDRNYVIYIRNTVDFFLSMYSQKIQGRRGFSTQEYSEFLQKCEADLVPFGPESSFGNLFTWSKILGEKLNVRLLESDFLAKGDLIDDFASLASVATFHKPSKTNKSIAADRIEYVRFLNREFRDNLPHDIRMKAIRVLKKISSGNPKIAMSDSQAKMVRGIHRDQEEKIRSVFFQDRPLLFSPKFHGCGIAPVPLTERRKAEIELEIRKQLDVWVPHKLAGKGGGKGHTIADRPAYWVKCLEKSWWD